MSDRKWNFFEYFFLFTVIIGGLTLAYFGERNQINFIMNNIFIKTGIIVYFGFGAFFIVLTGVRRKTKRIDLRSIGIAAGILCVAFIYLAITRL